MEDKERPNEHETRNVCKFCGRAPIDVDPSGVAYFNSEGEVACKDCGVNPKITEPHTEAESETEESPIPNLDLTMAHFNVACNKAAKIRINQVKEGLTSELLQKQQVDYFLIKIKVLLDIAMGQLAMKGDRTGPMYNLLSIMATAGSFFESHPFLKIMEDDGE